MMSLCQFASLYMQVTGNIMAGPSLDRKDGNITRTAIGARPFDKGDDGENLQLNATNEIMNVKSVKTMTEGMLP